MLVFNSAVLYQVSAAIKYTPNSGAGNFWTIADKELSYTDTSMNAGAIGAIINQPLNNGFLGDESYSVKYARCVEEFGAEACKPSYTTLSTVTSLGAPGNGFSTVNAISSLNVALLNERPVSAVDYVQDKVYALTHFNVVSAQTADASVTSREAYYSPGGTGFTLLKPIQNFWSWAVRVVYGFLLIIVVIIAFAIMFRQRLSGNVEVTVQNAIPAIAMAMILVPLSYAISGLFIDVITVGTNAVHAFLIGTPGAPGYNVYQGSSDPSNLNNPLDPSTPYADRGYYPDDVRVDWLRARDKINVATAFGDIAQDVGQVSGLNGNVIFLAVGSIVNAITGKGSTSDPADFTWVGDIVQFFISIVTLWIGVQVFVHLFKKYITIILYPIMSPFIFATVAIPGNGTKSIMQYAKVMLAAALAFIVTYAMFLLSIVFTSKEFLADVPTFASGSFNPPLLGLKSIGIGSNELTQLLLTLIGLGIYFSIPSTLKSIDTALGADKPLPKFITTPIDSFKESQRVMFKKLPAGVLAGGAGVVGGIRGGARGIANIRTGVAEINKLPSKARGYARQQSMSYQNWRKGGLKPGEKGSSELEQADSISRKIQEKEALRRQALNDGRYGEARKLAKEVEDLKKDASDLNVSNYLSSNIKDEDKMKLNAVFKGNSSTDNEIIFRTPEIDALTARAAGLKVAAGGKLVLEATGKDNVLPKSIQVEIYEAIQDATTGKYGKSGLIATLSSTQPVGDPAIGAKALGLVYSAAKHPLDAEIKLVCTATPTNYVSVDGRKIEINFDLLIDAVTAFRPIPALVPARLFGTKVAPATTYTGGWIDTVSPAKMGSAASGTLLDRFIIKIGELESDPIKINIKYVV